jgi:hypothetical protein
MVCAKCAMGFRFVMCWVGLGSLQELAGKLQRPSPAYQEQVYNSVVIYHCVLQKPNPPIVAALLPRRQHPRLLCLQLLLSTWTATA